jgi:RNA polymerase sigma-32 factor
MSTTKDETFSSPDESLLEDLQAEDLQEADKDVLEPEVVEDLVYDQALVRYDPLQSYLQEIQKYPLLSREEEQELAIRYKKYGDKEAAYRLITSNLRLVVKIALEFQKNWMMNLMDLIQEGNIGLMQAVQKFDPYRGVKLSSYASYWIKAYILKFILDNWRLIKIGTTQAQRKLFFNLKKEKERLDRLGFDPQPRLIAENLDVKEEDVIEMDQRMGSWEYSLDSPLDEDSRYTHKDTIATPQKSSEELLGDQEFRNLIHHKLNELKPKLGEKERDILERRLLAEKPATLQEIGDKWGISRERVRQIEERLKKKIGTYLVQEIPDFEPSDLSFL